MLFMTTYKIKPFLSNEETKKLLEVFAKEGPGPGTTRITWLRTAATAW